ncbi:hypothetical protein Tco_0484739 [Tanacetum coccineum]
MTTIFHELIEDSMDVFMDDFSVFGSSFDHCLKNLEKMLKRCEETNLVLNWYKCHFMVKEGIVLGHKVSGSGIEVDKAKIKAISKLPSPTNVKFIQSFLGHAGFCRRFIKDFSQIAHPMTQLLVKDAPFNFSEESPRLERQLDAAAGALRAAEDAPAVDECAQADPAPVQAPQPPPPVPRTMPQRIARLKEEVQELRRSIVGLRGDVDRSITDQDVHYLDGQLHDSADGC